MDQELAFKKIIEELKDLAFLQDNIVTMEQVTQALAEFTTEKEHINATIEYLKQCKIGVGEAVNLDDYMTNEERNYLSMYMEELNQLTIYSVEEQMNFFKQAMNGNKEAVKVVVEIFLTEVIDIAKLYVGQGVDIEDLIGEGNMILFITASMLECCETIDEAKAMLVKAVMEVMENCIAKSTKAKTEDDQISKQVNAVANAAEELAEELQKEVTIEEIMEEYKFSRNYILEAIQFSGRKIEYMDLTDILDDKGEKIEKV